MRTWSILFGIGLGILWIMGLGTAYSAPWLSWLDGAGALLAFILAGSLNDTAPRNVRIGGPIALSLGLFALWLIGMSTNGAPFQNWWTFAFACGFLLIALAGSNRRYTLEKPSTTDVNDQFRRSA